MRRGPVLSCLSGLGLGWNGAPETTLRPHPRSLRPCARLFLEKGIEEGVFFWGAGGRPVLSTPTLLPRANLTAEGRRLWQQDPLQLPVSLSPIMLRGRFEKLNHPLPERRSALQLRWRSFPRPWFPRDVCQHTVSASPRTPFVVTSLSTERSLTTREATTS